MAKYKNTFNENMTFDYTELTALCEHLKIREREGKKLKEIDKYNLTYDICQPRDIRYSAVIFNNDLMHKDFIASCEQEGWEYVTAYNELYIFRTQNTDATEIMTDEKEYFKIITKRFLLRPSFLGFSATTFNTFLRFLTYNMRSNILWIEPPLTADILFYLWLFVLFSSLMVIFMKTSEFIEWYIKAKKAVKNDERIPFLNLEQRKNKLIARGIIYGMIFTVLAVSVIYILFGYIETSNIKYIIYTIALILCVLIAFTIYDKTKNSGKLKALFLSLLSFALIMAGAYGLETKMEIAYKENTKIIKQENIPITLTDFYCTEEHLQENEIKENEGTRFGQYYIVKSLCPDCEKSIYYIVFKSDYPLIRRSFINDLKKENNTDYIYKKENSQWDEEYRIILDDKITNYGFSVKGNTVIYLPDHLNFIDNFNFFDIAYNKLFT